MCLLSLEVRVLVHQGSWSQLDLREKIGEKTNTSTSSCWTKGLEGTKVFGLYRFWRVKVQTSDLKESVWT